MHRSAPEKNKNHERQITSKVNRPSWLELSVADLK
jgi:hypothetical protein